MPDTAPEFATDKVIVVPAIIDTVAPAAIPKPVTAWPTTIPVLLVTVIVNAPAVPVEDVKAAIKAAANLPLVEPALMPRGLAFIDSDPNKPFPAVAAVFTLPPQLAKGGATGCP